MFKYRNLKNNNGFSNDELFYVYRNLDNSKFGRGCGNVGNCIYCWRG